MLRTKIFAVRTRVELPVILRKPLNTMRTAPAELMNRRSRIALSWSNSDTPHRFLRILGRMRISGAFLAEKVDAVNNKLNVTGGVISKFKVGRDRAAQFDIVVLTQGDTEGADRLIVIEVSPPDGGEPLHMHRELPANLTNADVGFACFQFRLTLNLNGRWTVNMKGGAGAVSLPLTVSGPSPR